MPSSGEPHTLEFRLLGTFEVASGAWVLEETRLAAIEELAEVELARGSASWRSRSCSSAPSSTDPSRRSPKTPLRATDAR